MKKASDTETFVNLHRPEAGRSKRGAALAGVLLSSLLLLPRAGLQAAAPKPAVSGAAALLSPSPSPSASPSAGTAASSPPREGRGLQGVAFPARLAADLQIDRIEQGVIFFKSGLMKGAAAKGPDLPPLDTHLFDVTPVGVLHAGEKSFPYFLLAGKTCQNCELDRALFVVSPHRDDNRTAYVYPGRVLDPKTRAILLDSEAFYGECLPHRPDIYIVFQKEKVDRRQKLQESVLVVEPAQAHLLETLLERHLPKLRVTRQLVQQGKCFRVPTWNRLASQITLNLRPQEQQELNRILEEHSP